MEYDGDAYDKDEQHSDEQYEDEQHEDDQEEDDHQDEDEDEELYDQTYDVEKEDDLGEKEDAAHDEFVRRMVEMEEQADNAALLNIEILGTEEEQQRILTERTNKKTSGWIDRKPRGPVKGLKKAHGPMHIQFDSLLRPCGPFRHQYGQNIGLCMRKLNINWDWKTVSVGLKDALWRDNMSLFNVPNDAKLKKFFLSSVARRFADFKSKLVSGWITKTRKRTKKEDNREPPQIYKHIKEADWALFIKTKTDGHATKIRERAIKNAKMNVHHHHMGQATFEESRVQWIKDGFYPACTLGALASTSDTRIDINRGDDWYCAVHKKDKKTGQREIPSLETKKAADLYLEYREKQKKGEFEPSRNKDALHMALGGKLDHPGRVRGVGGVNVGIRMVYIGSDTKVKKRVQSTEDREKLKNELRQELREEFEEHLRGNLFSHLQRMGLSLPNQSASSNSIQPIQVLPFEPNQVDVVAQQNMNVDTPTPEPNDPSPEFEDDTRVRLLIEDPTSLKLLDAGLGSAFGSDGKATVRGKQVKPRHVKVKVQVAFEEMKSAPLPVPIPQNEILYLEDAVGSFVEWPIKFVIFPSKKENVQNKEVEVRGSNSFLTKESTPRKQVRPSLPKSLSKECLWLHTCVSLVEDAHTFEIKLNAHSFYFDNDVAKIWLTKRDIEEFLSGAKLNISIIQVFIKYLEDECLLRCVGWLCPESTSTAKIKANGEEVKNYIFRAISLSAECVDKFLLAPIHQDSHWLLLGICVPKATIYLFNSINKLGDSLQVRPLVNFAFHRFKLSGGVTSRKKPLWKIVKCAQQVGGLECGFYVMKYMDDVVRSCSNEEDLEKVFRSPREEPFTDEEIQGIRDKWANYFTSKCMN